MSGELDGKVALISGASMGIGEADARRFVEEGAEVMLGDIEVERGQALAAELGDAASFVELDVTQPDLWEAAVAATVATYGALHILVNNAGVVSLGSIVDVEPEEFLRVMHVNQFGVFLGMRAAIPAMKASGGGSIINMSSTAGLRGGAGLVAYTSSKWAVRGMTKCAALELGHDNIRVNSVHPGATDTPLLRGGALVGVDQDALFGSQPIPRVGQPEDIAELVLFLASERSAFSTGAEFVADGGNTVGAAPPRL